MFSLRRDSILSYGGLQKFKVFYLFLKKPPYSEFSQLLQCLQMLFMTAGIGTKELSPKVVPGPPGSWGLVVSAWCTWAFYTGSDQPGRLKGQEVLRDTLRHVLQQEGELAGSHTHFQWTVTLVCA